MSIKQKIADILIILLLIVINLLPGSPLRYNIYVPNTIVNIIAILYIGVLIYKKKQIKINKIDITIIILSLSTFIPLIFRTYLRLGDTIEYILKYISALNIYFIIRQYISNSENTEKNVSIITKTITVMSIIMIFIGIDMMASNYLNKIYDFFKAPIMYKETLDRMGSLFKYSNTFCAYISITLFITLGNYLNEENKFKKAFYSSAIFIQLFAIIMSYSRLCWGITAILLIIYICILKEKRKQIITVLTVCFINSFIYYCVFSWLINRVNTIGIFSVLILESILTYILFIFIDNIKVRLQSLIKKKLLVILFLGLVLIIAFIIVYYIIQPDYLLLFNDENYIKLYRKQNITVDKNTNNVIKIDLEAISDVKDNFIIRIKQYDDQEKNITEDNIVIDNYKGTKEIVFLSHENTESVSILFECNTPNKNTSLKINSVKLNDKTVKIRYKIIPINLANRISKLKLNSASIKIRIEYIKKSLEIVKRNVFFGYGGYAWKNLDVKNVNEKTVAEHSYPIQLFMQNGIVAIITYIFLIICIIIELNKIVKIKNTIHISIFMALNVLILHSVLDFDMYFQIMIFYMYIFIAVISTVSNQEYKKIGKPFNFIWLVCLIVLLYFNLGETISLQIDTSKIKDYKQKLNVINTKILLNPFYYKNYEDKINCLSTIKNIGYNLPNFEIEKEIIKSAKFIVDSEKMKEPYIYNVIILNKISLMTEENQDEVLDEVKRIWENDIGANNKDIYKGIKIRLLKTLDNEKTKKFIENLKLIDI